MKIRKVRYAPRIPGKIERHCAAFLTQTGQVLLVDSVWDSRDNVNYPFFNIGDAVRFASGLMKGKSSTLRIAPIIGALAWESTKYDKNLVDMAKTGQLINAIVIENIPDSIEELQHFASNALKESLTYR